MLWAATLVLSSGLAGKKFRTGINLRNQRRVKNRGEEVGNLKFCGATTPGLNLKSLRAMIGPYRSMGPCHKATNSAILCIQPVQSGPATYAPFLAAFSARSYFWPVSLILCAFLLICATIGPDGSQSFTSCNNGAQAAHFR